MEPDSTHGEQSALLLFAPTCHPAIQAVGSRNAAILRGVLADENARLRLDDEDDGELEALTALHWAARCGLPDHTELLLAAGASPAVRSRYGETPLHMAAAEGHGACVTALLRAGAAVECVCALGERAIGMKGAENGGIAEAGVMRCGRGGIILGERQGAFSPSKGDSAQR